MVKFVCCSEVIIDISSTVVDESKQIVLVEFASLAVNVSLRMPYMSLFELEAISNAVVAIVTVVDTQGRGYCAEAKYSMLEFSVPLVLSLFRARLNQNSRHCYRHIHLTLPRIKF